MCLIFNVLWFLELLHSLEFANICEVFNSQCRFLLRYTNYAKNFHNILDFLEKLRARKSVIDFLLRCQKLGSDDIVVSDDCERYESDVKVTWKWCESDVKVMWKWCESDVKVLWKCCESDVRVMWKWYQSDVTVTWKWCGSDDCESVKVMWKWCKRWCESDVKFVMWKRCESDVKMMWKWCESDVKVMWNWCESDVKVIWQWCESDARVMRKSCESDVNVMWQWWGDIKSDVTVTWKWKFFDAKVMWKRCESDVKAMWMFVKMLRFCSFLSIFSLCVSLFQSYLIRPFQRINEYETLLSKLRSVTPKDHSDFKAANSAYTQMHNLCAEVSELWNELEHRAYILRFVYRAAKLPAHIFLDTSRYVKRTGFQFLCMSLHDVPSHIFFALSLSNSLAPSLPRSFILSFSHSLTLSGSLTLSLSHSHSFSSTLHSLTLALSHSVTFARSRISFSLSLSLSLSLSHSHSLTLSLSHSLTLSFFYSHSHLFAVSLSRSLTLSLSHSLILPFSLFHSFTLSLSHALFYYHSHYCARSKVSRFSIFQFFLNFRLLLKRFSPCFWVTDRV